MKYFEKATLYWNDFGKIKNVFHRRGGKAAGMKTYAHSLIEQFYTFCQNEYVIKKIDCYAL
ncbi:MAG: hypothetical protein LUE11_02025 [Clostridia bacterium]|nr:hypothetical protein [Clostridia bacterium]